MSCLRLQYRSEQKNVFALHVVYNKYRENHSIQKEETDHKVTESVCSKISINTVGSLVEQRQFGAWGTVDYFSKGLQASEFNHENSLLSRGYTGHEHFFGVALIHMNGRMYDANLGRFLSPDDHIQEPFNTQSFNRYGYVWNNPLSGIDPDGETVFDWVKKEDGSIYWDPNAVNQATTKAGETYIGPDKSDVFNDYRSGLNSFQSFLYSARLIGPNIDFASKVSADLTPIIQDAIQRQKSAVDEAIAFNNDPNESEFIGNTFSKRAGVSQVPVGSYLTRTKFTVMGKTLEGRVLYFKANNEIGNTLVKLSLVGTTSDGLGGLRLINTLKFSNPSNSGVIFFEVQNRNDYLMIKNHTGVGLDEFRWK